MTKVTFSIANALAKLRAPDLEPIIEFLSAERSDSLEKMVTVVEEVQWRRLQGRAQLIEELLKLVEDAPALAAKLRDAPR